MGDACGLFNNATPPTPTSISVVCARVSNLNADPNDVRILELAAGKPVYLFNCSDKKNDRCTNPDPVAYTAGEVTAGQIGALASGNLITETDPFGPAFPNGPGEAYPHDTTIDVRIPNNKVPTGSMRERLLIPAAGNGGNNNPFDCIVTPGRPVRDACRDEDRRQRQRRLDRGHGVLVQGRERTSTTFTAVGSSTTQGSNSAQVPVGTYSVVEDAVTGYDTTYTNSKNTNLNCTSLAVTAGATTTCNITNDDTIASPTIATTMKWTLNDFMAPTGHRDLLGWAATATFSLYNTVGCTGTPLVTEQVSVNDFSWHCPDGDRVHHDDRRHLPVGRRLFRQRPECHCHLPMRATR